MENLRINNDVGGGQAGSNGSGDGIGNGQQMPPPSQPMSMPMDMQQGMSGSHQAGPLAQRSGGGNGTLGGGNGNGNGMGGGNGGGIPQLPPQMFTTAASLLDLTDSMFSYFFLVVRFLLEGFGDCWSWDLMDHSSNITTQIANGRHSPRKTYGCTTRRTETDRRAKELGPVR